MKTLLLVILVVTFLSVVAMFLNDFYIKREFRKYIGKKLQLLEALKQKFDSQLFVKASLCDAEKQTIALPR